MMWARLVNTALGIWLMAAPAVLGYGDAAQVNDRIVGPIIASFALIAAWEVTRGVRWVNLALGGWLIMAPFILRYDQWPPAINSLLVGAAVILLTLVRGRITQKMGGGWSALWREGNGNKT